MIRIFLCLYQAFSAKVPINIYKKSLDPINIPQSNNFTIITSNSSLCESCFFIGSSADTPNLDFTQNKTIWKTIGEFTSIESYINKKLELIIPPKNFTSNIKISVFSFTQEIGIIDLVISYTNSGCPVECEEHGKCLNNEFGIKYCQCFEGYFGYGCSVLVKDAKIDDSVSTNVTDFGIAFFNIEMKSGVTQIVSYDPKNEVFFFSNANPNYLPSFLDCQDKCDESELGVCNESKCYIGFLCAKKDQCSINIKNTVKVASRSILLIVIISTFTIICGLGIPLLIFLCCRRCSQARNEVPKQMSAEEFENLCPEIKWSDDNKSETCSICLDDFNSSDRIRKLKCNHIFHTKCIDEWALSHPTCPVCKDVIKIS
ncbi:hypothetical protein SteCoe_19033 [Stentor coeruleus]|uniref:RING-type domain-containing protein n=1 Tax=Stentor coeruleus TaxID=5963 RepID=A0A1R2BV86_9CILI|nr:hypothetical protein SteCoe_19033 [Stentor coeruleus]